MKPGSTLRTSYGDRSVAFVGQRLWNGLPANLRHQLWTIQATPESTFI